MRRVAQGCSLQWQAWWGYWRRMAEEVVRPVLPPRASPALRRLGAGVAPQLWSLVCVPGTVRH